MIEKKARVKIFPNVEIKHHGGKVILGISSAVKKGAYITVTDATFHLDDMAVIGAYNWLQCASDVYIGKRTILGPNVVITTSSHKINRSECIRNRHTITRKIFIDKDCWIGANVTIRDGVTIGEGVVVGANSFVNKNIPPYQVWGGVPAKFIKERK